MDEPRVDDLVELTRDVPELSLFRGKKGVIRSTWFIPTTAYEVEFEVTDPHQAGRALLLPEQIARSQKQ
ncbi:MAG: DUF4926 domain-containing protein [bacterium]|nr:DUF4926 domain-containing protein [bacterium]